MMTVERTGGGLCGETHVRAGTRTLVFAPDADVSMTEHGIRIIEAGLATTRTTYLLDIPQTKSAILVENAVALRVHDESGHRLAVHSYPPLSGTVFHAEATQSGVTIYKHDAAGTQKLSAFPAHAIKAIVAEAVSLPPPPTLPPVIAGFLAVVRSAVRP